MHRCLSDHESGRVLNLQSMGGMKVGDASAMTDKPQRHPGYQPGDHGAKVRQVAW